MWQTYSIYFKLYIGKYCPAFQQQSNVWPHNIYTFIKNFEGQRKPSLLVKFLHILYTQ